MNSRLPGMCKRSPQVCKKLRWNGLHATPSHPLLTLQAAIAVKINAQVEKYHRSTDKLRQNPWK